MMVEAPLPEQSVKSDKAADLKATIARKLDLAGADLQDAHLQAAIARALACPHAAALLQSSSPSEADGQQLAVDDQIANDKTETAASSVGSARHASGRCKPCAFFHTKGCASGERCAFCHLCESDEKKKRKKEKLALRGMRRRQRNEQRVVSQMVGTECDLEEEEGEDVVAQMKQTFEPSSVMLLGRRDAGLHSASLWDLGPPGLFVEHCTQPTKVIM